MSNLYNLSGSQAIVSLLDGELPKNQVSQVFYELANNNGLQDEFLDYINIKKNFKFKPVNPPEDLKKGLFLTLGLTGSGAAAAMNSNPGFWQSLISNRIVLSTLSAVCSAVITYFLLINFNGTGNVNITSNTNLPNTTNQNQISNIGSPNNNGNSNLNTSSNGASSINATQSKRKIARVINLRNSENQTQTYENANEINSDNKVNKTSSSLNQQSVNNINLNPIENIQSIPIRQINMNNSHITIPNNQEAGDDFIPVSRAEMYAFSENSNLSMSFRGFSSKSMVDFSLPSETDPIINNIAICINFYEISEKLHFGIEFGQENFLHQFNATNGLISRTVQQNSLSFWWGAKLTYDFNAIQALSNMKPYLSLVGGMTSIGPMGRAGAGLTYDFSDKFSMQGGFEATNLETLYNNSWTGTNKLGFTYGVLMKF